MAYLLTDCSFFPSAFNPTPAPSPQDPRTDPQTIDFRVIHTQFFHAIALAAMPIRNGE
jgi:hypothetical protein